MGGSTRNGAPLAHAAWVAMHAAAAAAAAAGWTFECADAERLRNALGDALFTYLDHRDSFRQAPWFAPGLPLPFCGRDATADAILSHTHDHVPLPALTPPPPLVCRVLPACRGLQLRGMQQDLSWEHAAELYEDVLVQAKYQW